MIRSSNVGRSKTMNIGGSTTEAIQEIREVGFSNASLPSSDVVMLSTPTGYQDYTVSLGISEPSWGTAIALADFDNDMDLDAYIAATGPVENRHNLLFENVGSQMLAVGDAGGASGSLDGRADAVALADYDNDGFVDIITVNGRSKAPFDQDGPIQLFRNTGNSNNWLEVDLEGIQSNRDGVGAIVVAQAGGISQTRTQDSGILFKGQSDSRLHFGLADNSRVDSLQISWPSGIQQTIDRVPANHVLRVVEPTAPTVHGAPDYTPGSDSGVYIWKEHFDGPYHLYISGDSNLDNWDIYALSSKPFISTTASQLDSDDQLSWSQNLVHLSATVSSSDNGIEFMVEDDATTVLSTKKNGEYNPRFTHFGETGIPSSPGGWVFDKSTLPQIDQFLPLVELGIVVGQSGDGQRIEARWSGDKSNPFNHHAKIGLLSSKPLSDVTPISFESCCDVLTADTHALNIKATMSSSWDAISTAVPDDAVIALLYEQDTVFQSHRYLSNNTPDRFGNAFVLPLPDLVGVPEFDPSTERGLFVFRDDEGWLRIRASAGGVKAVYDGSIVSDKAPIQVLGNQLESNDILAHNSSLQIDFKLSIWNHYLDGLDIKYPPGTKIEISLNSDSGSPENDIFLGADKWPVLSVPVSFNLP